MLKKYVPYASHKIDYKNLEIKEDMSYIEKPFGILDTKKKVRRKETMSMVKVEADLRIKYPELFA